MKRFAKISLILAGYLAACLVASGAVYVNQLFYPPSAAQASAGMSAFGDFILFIGTFGVLALFPTALALYFLFRKLVSKSSQEI